MNNGFAGQYWSTGIVAGSPLDAAALRRHWQCLEIIAAAREQLDPEPIIGLLAENAAYESQDTLEPLVGRDAIAAYLRKRFAFFRGVEGAGAPAVRMLPAVVDLPEAEAHPCLVFTHKGARQALWALRLDAELREIARLDILTSAPPPDAATLTGAGAGD